jgi:hypothetical protein
VGNSRGELEEKLTLRAVCKKVLVGAAVSSREVGVILWPDLDRG